MTERALGDASPAEIHARVQAERAGHPHLVFRDERGVQLIVPIPSTQSYLTIGRGEGTEVRVSWDPEVSAVHAELERIGGVWTVCDDGLSRNGTFVNGERVVSRIRLRDRDVLRVGQTVIMFRAPAAAGARETERGGPALAPPTLSPAQRRVLLALCRPYKEPGQFTTPATNKDIAAEVVLTVEAVKTHLRVLSVKFGVQDVPQNQKRAKLVERAFQTGLISKRDL